MPDHDRTIKEFLDNPDEHRRFSAFYEACFHIARGYLSGLASKGWRIRLDQFSSDSALNDCTIDVLATLFTRDDRGRYTLIQDYFSKFPEAHTTPGKLTAMLFGLIKGHIHQELHKIVGEVDAQAHNLRRRVKSELASDSYEQFDHGGRACCRWREAVDGRREDLPSVHDSQFEHWVIQAGRSQTTVPGRCLDVFQRLDRDDQFQNFLVVYRIVSMMIRVFLDDSDLWPSNEPGARAAYIIRRMRALGQRVADDTIRDVLTPLAEKRNICETVQGAYRRALTNLMDDFATQGDHDKLPTYLYEQLEIDSQAYLADCKHVWETVVKGCLERFRELLIQEGLGSDGEGVG